MSMTKHVRDVTRLNKSIERMSQAINDLVRDQQDKGLTKSVRNSIRGRERSLRAARAVRIAELRAMEKAYLRGRADAATQANIKAAERIKRDVGAAREAAQRKIEKLQAHAERMEQEKSAVLTYLKQHHPAIATELYAHVSARRSAA